MTLQGHFDGRVVVLDEPPPADWGPNMPVVVAPAATANQEVSTAAPEPNKEDGSVFLWIAERAKEWDFDLPPDFSEQLDHYLYGTPKR